MKSTRLEAFSDGVIAIILTIMVLEFKVPHDASLASLVKLYPIFVSYVLSFIYIGIYWNNHHHMMVATKHINGGILWANLHLLFWMSLVPFVTGWMGENHFTRTTVGVYGVILLNTAIAYFLLQSKIIKANGGKDSDLAKMLGKDVKGKISPFIYLVAIVSSFWSEWIAGSLYVLVALIWLVPDRRNEKKVLEEEESEEA